MGQRDKSGGIGTVMVNRKLLECGRYRDKIFYRVILYVRPKLVDIRNQYVGPLFNADCHKHMSTIGIHIHLVIIYHLIVPKKSAQYF